MIFEILNLHVLKKNHVCDVYEDIYLQTCNARLGKLVIDLAHHQGHTRAYLDITHLEYNFFKTLQKALNFINIF